MGKGSRELGDRQADMQEWWMDVVKTQAGVPVILNGEWIKPMEGTDLSSPSPPPPSTPPASPLSDCPDLVSAFGSSSSDSSLLFT